MERVDADLQQAEEIDGAGRSRDRKLGGADDREGGVKMDGIEIFTLRSNQARNSRSGGTGDEGGCSSIGL
jgi:hypothetical protein